MTNIEELLERIKALPEIELQELFEGLSEYIHREKLIRTAAKSLKISDDEIDDLKDDLSDAENSLAAMEKSRDKHMLKLERAKEDIDTLLESDETEASFYRNEIQEIYDKL